MMDGAVEGEFCVSGCCVYMKLAIRLEQRSETMDSGDRSWQLRDVLSLVN